MKKIEIVKKSQLENTVFLSNDMKVLFFLNESGRIRQYSMLKNGVLLGVVGDAIVPSVARDTSFLNAQGANIPKKLLFSFPVQIKSSGFRSQVQISYLPVPRQMFIIGISDIEASKSMNKNVVKMDGNFQIASVKMVETDPKTQEITYAKTLNLKLETVKKEVRLAVYEVGAVEKATPKKSKS